MPEYSLINFKYSIEISNGVLFIKDARLMEIVNDYFKVPSGLNINEELTRIVFFAPVSPTILDFKELKKGLLRFENFQNGDKFLINFIDKDGNNCLSDVVTSFMGSDEFDIDTIANTFFQ